MSPQSPYSELSSPNSVQTDNSLMQTDEQPINKSTPVRSTPNLHRGGGLSVGGGGSSPPAKMSVSGTGFLLRFYFDNYLPF